MDIFETVYQVPVTEETKQPEQKLLKYNTSTTHLDYLNSLNISWLIFVCIYSVVALITFGLFELLSFVESKLTQEFIVAIIVCFILTFGNTMLPKSSIFGPFWSLMILALSWYWFLDSKTDKDLKGALALLAITIYSTRNLFVFVTEWKGISHENFLYEEIKNKCKESKILFCFCYIFTIHVIPTMIIFAACLPLYHTFYAESCQEYWLVWTGFVIMIAGISIEGIAHEQMLTWQSKNLGLSYHQGLWRYSRHPNYFGETLFWFGAYIMVLGVDPFKWWTLFAPILFTMMIYFVTVPILEARMIKKYPDYVDYKMYVSRFVPWKNRDLLILPEVQGSSKHNILLDYRFRL